MALWLNAFSQNDFRSDVVRQKKDLQNQTLTRDKNNLVLVVSLPELSAGRWLNASFVFSLCRQWERLQTAPLYSYEGLRARVSAVSICSASQIPLSVCKHREDVATVWRRPAFIRRGLCVNFPLTGCFSQGQSRLLQLKYITMIQKPTHGDKNTHETTS